MKLEYSDAKKTAGKLKFRTKAFIGGKFVNAASGKTYVSVNPATGRPLTNIASCDGVDVDLAVKAARRSFEQGVWSKRSPAERKQVLLKLADLLEENFAEIALLDCLDAGKPITDCMTIDAPDTVHCFRWHAEAIDKEYEQVAPTGPGNVAMIVREPLGVIGAILRPSRPSVRGPCNRFAEGSADVMAGVVNDFPRQELTDAEFGPRHHRALVNPPCTATARGAARVSALKALNCADFHVSLSKCAKTSPEAMLLWAESKGLRQQLKHKTKTKGNHYEITSSQIPPRVRGHDSDCSGGSDARPRRLFHHGSGPQPGRLLAVE
jgi:hypothetical protein